jgi:hypothetical protein
MHLPLALLMLLPHAAASRAIAQNLRDLPLGPQIAVINSAPFPMQDRLKDLRRIRVPQSPKCIQWSECALLMTLVGFLAGLFFCFFFPALPHSR